MYPPLPKDAKSKAKIAPKKIQEVKLLNDIRYSLLFFIGYYNVDYHSIVER